MRLCSPAETVTPMFIKSINIEYIAKPVWSYCLSGGNCEMWQKVDMEVIPEQKVGAADPQKEGRSER